GKCPSRSPRWRAWRWPKRRVVRWSARWTTPPCCRAGAAQPRTTGCWLPLSSSTPPRSSCAKTPTPTTWSRRSAKGSRAWAWVSAKSCVTAILTRLSAGSTSGSPRKRRIAAMTDSLIPQQYVGRMNVVGDCFVFGAALHDNRPVYLDIAGPATSVEAVWARLAQGKEARIVPDTGSSIVLQPPEPGLFARFQRKIDGLGIDHLLLVHKTITEPVYSELSETFLFFTGRDQATAILGN